MSELQVNPLVDQLVHGRAPSVARLEQVLDTSLTPTQDNPQSQMYALELKNGAF